MPKQYRKLQFITGLSLLFVFSLFSILVKKSLLKNIDFDITVKLQDHISRRIDLPFSYFSILGSAEITSAILLIFCLFILIKRRRIFFGAILFIISTAIEILGKIFIVHPSPPFFLLRYDLGFSFPSFYVHTNYSYPSGHMTRTAFLITVFLFLIIISRMKPLGKAFFGNLLLFAGFTMFLSRIYLGEHWFSDVLGGLLLGSAAGFFALALW